MIVAIDVAYDDVNATAVAAAVVFEHWHDSHPGSVHRVLCAGIQPYVPGEFFRRELPCLCAVLNTIDVPLHAIVIDGYVSLGPERLGLGMHLWHRQQEKTPIIGVAKTAFHGAPSIAVHRGRSKVPLFVTAIGIEPSQAAEHIREMSGAFRMPDLLRQVDRLTKQTDATL